MVKEARFKLRARCGMVYSPSSPIERFQLFAGRSEQVKLVAKAITTRGKHAILYGEPGVGKTSLAMVMRDVFDDVENLYVFKVNCVVGDTFDSVWRRIFAEITVVHEPVDITKGVAEYTLDQYVDSKDGLSPGGVSGYLKRVCDIGNPYVLIFDEFNRLDPLERAKFADAIKNLSDDSIHATVLLVGVATDVSNLIVEHSSVSRCLSQIKMAPMNGLELREIVEKANNQLGMTIDDTAMKLIVGLSQGFPHYTHSIAQESTYNAIDKGDTHITCDHVRVGIQAAILETDRTLRTDYRNASEGQRSGTLFPEVVLACAMAKTNDLGEFSSMDVRTPLRKLTGKKYEIPSFSSHLNKLSTDRSRGPILNKTGAARRYRFSFRNPLLKPFILMEGLSEKRITEDFILEWIQKQPGYPSAPLYGA